MEPPVRYSAVQKLCTLRTHDAATFKEDVYFNLDRFPELDPKPGDLIQIVAIAESNTTRDTENRLSSGRKQEGSFRTTPTVGSSPAELWNSRKGYPLTTLTFDENGRKVTAVKQPDKSRSYVFPVQDIPLEQRKKFEGVGLSISSTIASIFGLKNRNQVLVSVTDEESHSASHVEITFRDQYLSRADMWRLVISELSQKTVYKDQKLVFLDTIKATVKNVYRNGEKKQSGYFGASTKPIFRSESARYIIFIQMSKEMWEFDVDGGGEIMFNKVINGFLPELFKNWSSIHARHLISIVLFSRVEYEESDPRHLPTLSDEEDGPRAGSRDFYRVVVSDASSNDWLTILHQLKREFRTFLRDITVQKSAVAERQATGSYGNKEGEPDYVIVGKPSSAAKGNLLETLNLASSHFSRDYIDRDLVRTGISVVVITAGSGVYQVDYSLLKMTTEILISSGIGIDLVCLAPMPLHSVPLFKYRNPKIIRPTSRGGSTNHASLDNTPRQSDILGMRGFPSLERSLTAESIPMPGQWSYAIPHWIDVSFWKGTTDEQSLRLAVKSPRSKRVKAHGLMNRPFSIRCVLYELEMMGYMENEMINIAIPLLHDHPMHVWHKMRHRITGRPATEIDRSGLQSLERQWMEDHDDEVFKPINRRISREEAAREFLRPISAERDIVRRRPSVKSDQRMETDNGSFRQAGGFPDLRRVESQSSQVTRPHRTASIMSFGSNTGKFSISSKSAITTPKMLERTATKFESSKNIDSAANSALIRHVASPPKYNKPPPSAFSVLSQFKSLLTRTPTSKEAQKFAAEGSPWERTEEPSLADLQQNLIGSGVVATRFDLDGRSKPIEIATGRIAHTRSSSGDIGSVETMRGHARYPKKASLPKSVKNDDAGAILVVASKARRVGPKPGLSSSADAPPLPQTLSPLQSITPWLVLVNPSNPRKNNYDINSQFRRWKHVFPKQLKTSSIKWKSLSSPASVPLTNDFFPTAQQLTTEYQQQPYNIAQNNDNELPEEPTGNEALVRELIAFRLAHGFQLIIGPAVAEYLGSQGPELANIFDRSYMVKDGATVFMSLGNSIHQLLCLPNDEVQVRCFHRKPADEVETVEGRDTLSYKPYIRTSLSPTYIPRPITFEMPTVPQNWNVIDNFLAGHENDFTENLQFWRARFVFIPIEIASSSRRALAPVTEDSEEEIRLEGLRKLTILWQKHRVAEEQGFASMRRRKDTNPLMIDYQTKDPSAVVAAGVEGLQLAEDNANMFIFSETERYSTDNIDLQKLAQDIQGEQGIDMLDRRWHWKLYLNSFLGSDLTSWLLERFRDIDSREDAVEFGNELMGKGLFYHVSKKHHFRDGNFFYHISSDYLIARADTKGWFSRKDKWSVPSTPMADASKIAYSSDASESRPATSSSSEASNEKHSAGQFRRRKAVLSHMLQYNVDIRKQSSRPEIINLHYDRLHSPDNCYHIRIDWMNVASKFIEDSISQWAVNARKSGLKLVEVPIAEATSISETHPFRSTYRIKLAVPPPQDAPRQALDPTSFATKDNPDTLFAQKSILKKLNFVLDVESASTFPQDVDVQFSWGKNEYRYTQYIHRSGTTLAQINDDGDFLLLANHLCNDRTHAARESAKFDQKIEPFHDRRNARLGSPSESPLVRPVSDSQVELDRTGKTVTAEEVKDEVEAYCHDEKALRAFFDELKKPVPTPSPHLGTAPIDMQVPSLRLPPKVVALKDTTS